MEDEELIRDRVMNTVERLEEDELETDEDLDALSYYVEASLSDGSIIEIYAVLATGGPHIELALFSGRVDGGWAGDSHNAAILDSETDEQLDHIGRQLKRLWNEAVIC
jgi:hypothetical protein